MQFACNLHHVLSPSVIAQSLKIAAYVRNELLCDQPDSFRCSPPEHFYSVRAMGDYLLYKQLAKAKAPIPVPTFAMEICTMYRDSYPDFATLFEAYLVILLNSASCERNLSHPNMVKTSRCQRCRGQLVPRSAATPLVKGARSNWLGKLSSMTALPETCQNSLKFHLSILWWELPGKASCL